MAVQTQHPVSAPPTAPIREKTGHLLLRGWCIFVIAAALAGTSWLMAFGTIGAGIAAFGSAIVSIVLWIVLRPEVQWPRLPWFAALYVAWAVASLTWTAYPSATLLTLGLLLATTVQAMFVGSVLTWRELVRAIASALKWILALSIVFELWVSLVWGGPVLPEFVRPDGPVDDPIVYWSRDNLFEGGRIQGLFGNANLLAVVALLGMIIFAVRWASHAPRRPLLVGWFALAAVLFVRAGSATAWLTAGTVVVVLVTVLLMRTSTRAGGRTRYYIAYAVVGLGGLTALWLTRDSIFTLLGRSSDLTGREGIWADVWAKAIEHPVIGWGFSTPWVPTDAFFDGWITDHGQTVMQAHNMWLDVFFQLGAIGLVLIVLTVAAFVWRSWFFAVDRPRWDLVADRPYSPLTLVPTLVGAVVLVQGLAETGPLVGWGWMFIVMLAFKIKQAPLIGRGPSEQRLVGEQGETPRDGR
ncbi:MAG: ligase [Microbacterium sp. SCN 70-200]|uniref:O-antigen ligase family protein n=1 Tax=unclassified Microbacterium TaxID=2609290 RepID=UPI00086F4D88|nr:MULTISPECIES: O-antigen ligase family protein [unclassified Microbacterium]MBN9213871.1 O-antigen ligase family protein [Microbacterium sp.]ODT42422.1 MAG: ligase [Microbacterium sp. SCN 70-200]OJV85450.1 MAG: ligase [Microbacterium sp. 70-16]